MISLTRRQTLALKALRIAEHLLLNSPLLGDLELSEEVDALADKLQARVKCAEATEKPDTIFGFPVVENPTMRTGTIRIARVTYVGADPAGHEPDYTIVPTS